MGTDSRKGLLLALFCAIFAAAAGTHALTPIFPEFKRALGADDVAVRWLTATFTLGYSVSGFLLGVLCDRLGRRRILLVSLGAYAFANALLFFATDYVTFLVLRGVAGLGTGGVSAAVIAISADAVRYERRGRTMAFVLSGSYVAVVIGIPLASVLANIRLTAVFAFLFVTAGVAWVWLLRAAPKPVGSAPTSDVDLFSLPFRAIARPGAKAALLTTFLNTTAAFCVLMSLADYCVDEFDSSLNQRTLLFFALGLGALPGAAFAGAMSDGIGKRRTVILALTGSLLVLPLLLLPERFPLFLGMAVLVALVQAARQGPFAAILTELADTSTRGSLVGWNSLASGIGLAAGSWWGAIGYARHGLTGSVLVALVALATSLLVFWRFVPCPVEARHAESEREQASPAERTST